MTTNEILMYAFNKKVSTKGLIYFCKIDEFDKVKITPHGIIEDFDENLCIKIVSPDVRDPTQLEIETALENFINVHGRKSFQIN